MFPTPVWIGECTVLQTHLIVILLNVPVSGFVVLYAWVPMVGSRFSVCCLSDAVPVPGS